MLTRVFRSTLVGPAESLHGGGAKGVIRCWQKASLPAGQVLRRKNGGRAGLADHVLVVGCNPFHPAEEELRHRPGHGFANRLFLEPLLRGRFPADVIEDTRSVTDWDFVLDRDERTIAAPLDALGVNYYTPTLVAASDGRGTRAVADGHGPGQATAWPGCEDVDFLPWPGPQTAMGWSIDADGLGELLLRLDRQYPGLPLLVTENGAAFDDRVEEGAVRDVARIRYLREHLAVLHRAVSRGVPVQGYFLWSLLDNFEWAEGYSKRFGIVYVDFETQTRIPKASAAWYRDVLAANGLPLESTAGGASPSGEEAERAPLE